MTQEQSGIQLADSLSANEFRVEINGEEISGVFAVRGLHIRCVDIANRQMVPSLRWYSAIRPYPATNGRAKH
jgi:hypothetical protein